MALFGKKPDKSDDSPFSIDNPAPTSIFLDLREGQLPDTLDKLVWEGRPSNPDATPLERHLSRQLAMAHADKVRNVCTHADVDAVLLRTTNNWWLRFDSEVSADERELLLGVEAALNRTYASALIAERKSKGLASITDEEAEDNSLIPYKLEYANPKDRYDNAKEDNPYITLYGTKGKRGGEWDVRTRLSNMLETCKLPTRLEYSYALNLDEGYVALEFSVPTENQFPSTRYDATYRAVSVAETVPSQRALYTVKLAALLASMCFGASVGITNVDIIGRDGSLGGYPIFTYRTKRFDFNRQVVQPMTNTDKRIDLAFAETPNDYVAILGITGMTYDLDSEGHFKRVAPLRLNLKESIPIWQDTRELPKELKAVLYADVVSELDIYHDEHPELMEELNVILDENRDSIVVSIMAIEEFLSRIEHIVEPALGAPEVADRTPLFCSKSLERSLIEMTQPGAGTRYIKICDASFNARGALAELYAELGEVERSLEADEELIRLAPMCSRGYMKRLITFGDLNRWNDVIKEAKRTIRILHVPEDVAMAYYRTAFAFWRTGDREAAAACYVLTRFHGPVTTNAREELDDLLREMGRESAPTHEEAMKIAESRGIKPSMTHSEKRLIAYIVVNMMDNGFAPLAEYLMLLLTLDSNDVFDSVYHSLRDGVPESA